MYPEPLLPGAQAAEIVKGAVGVVEVCKAGHYIGGGLDGLGPGALVLPVGVAEGVGGNHGLHVLLPPPAAGGALAGALVVGEAAYEVHVPVEVRRPLPGGDGRQVGRVLRRDEPLGDGQLGVPRHADFPAAPVLPGQPFNQVIAVLRHLGAIVIDVPLGVEGASGVRADHGVAVLNPVAGVGPLIFLIAGEAVQGDAAAVGKDVVAVGAAQAAKVPPGHDGGDFFLCHGAVDVDADLDAVPQGDHLVPLPDHGRGQGHHARPAYMTGGQDFPAGMESRIVAGEVRFHGDGVGEQNLHAVKGFIFSAHCCVYLLYVCRASLPGKIFCPPLFPCIEKEAGVKTVSYCVPLRHQKPRRAR